MDKAARLKLKTFLEDEIDFYGLKKIGFWCSGTRKTDYEKQAAKICHFFGFKSVYEYGVLTCSGIVCMGNKTDVCGMESGTSIIIRPNVDMGCPTNWNELRSPDITDLASQDKYLN